jgi:1,4-alpha-glucan branching enzyme
MAVSKFGKVSMGGKTSTMVEPFRESKRTGIKETECYGPCQEEDGVVFYAFYPQAKSVQVAGDFNDWNPQKSQMKKAAGGYWQLKIPLARGVYKYRFVVDGIWQQDPKNTMTEPNPYGEVDSVVKVV